jgi:molybdopterin-guanine dinucleotide biosynthesis protein A
MSSAAIILAGGRGSRLGGIDKPALEFEGRTLLDIAIQAAAGSATTVVVGPGAHPGVTTVREEPPWGGPAAALAAGMSALSSGLHGAVPGGHAEVLVLAADHPRVDEAVRRLSGVELGSSDGVVARDAGGRRQPLLARYRTDPLQGAIDSMLTERGTLAGASLRSLLAGLDLLETALPDELCADIDTPDDARRHGIVIPEPERTRTEAALSNTGDRHDRYH